MSTTNRKIDPEKVGQDGADIKKYGKEMYNALQEAKRLMEASKEVFDQDAADDMRASFKTVSDKFDDFDKLVEEYGNYLIEYAENQIQNNITIKKIFTLG